MKPTNKPYRCRIHSTAGRRGSIVYRDPSLESTKRLLQKQILEEARGAPAEQKPGSPAETKPAAPQETKAPKKKTGPRKAPAGKSAKAKKPAAKK